ncbi:MAG: AAA family ATPase [Caldilineaceae bacterium]|nr:AAA family ATPase [Caldilineaceae bacterium]
MSSLLLHLLGPPLLERDSAPLHITRRRALAFIIYLAVTGEAHHREQLAAFFWPEMDASHAHADLRRTLYQANQALGGEWLVAEGDVIRFRRDGDLWMDVGVFHQLLAETHAHSHRPDDVCPRCLPLLHNAVALYRNDFLAGFSLPDSPAFDDWQFFQSETLRQELAGALERLVRGHTAQDDYLAAISYARRWLALDPLHEPVHRWLMQLYAWDGQQAAALRQYAQCAQLLDEELGVAPAPETEQLHQAIRARRLVRLLPARPAASQPPGEELPKKDEIRVVTVVSVGPVASGVMSGAVSLDDGASEVALLDKEAGELTRLLAISQAASLVYGGQVEQLAGEDILIFYGVDQVVEDDPERGVRTALAIQRAAQREGLAVRVGVSAGLAYCRRGPGARPVVLGPTVELAARLRNRSDAGQILVNRAVYLPTRGVFVYGPEQLLALPGSSAVVRSHAVEGLRSRTAKARGVEGLHAAMVGRGVELAQISAVVDKARRGEGQMVALAGGAGVGKSRLVSEFKARSVYDASPTEPPLLWMEGRGQAFAESTSYSLFADLVAGYFGRAANGQSLASPLASSPILRELVEQGHLSPSQMEEVVLLLGQLLGAGLGNGQEEQLRHSSPEQLHQRMTRALVTLITALTRRQPLALVFEDLHWTDAHSLDLIAALLELLPAHRLLLLCVYRTEQSQPGEHLVTLARRICPERLTTVHLRELSQEESRQLVASLLAVERLSDPTRSYLLDKAQGNPLYLEEMVRSLIDRGLLYRQGENWRARADALVASVPESLHSLILSRVDRLQPAPRQALQMASVLGRFFRPSLLAAMTPSEWNLTELLSELTAHSFLYVERMLPELEYSFQHVLVRDAVYQAVPRARRRDLHRQAAQALETLYAENPGTVLEQIAYHYDQSDDTEKAIAYLLLAGEKARRVYANDVALASFRRALAHLDRADGAYPTQRLAALLGMGQVYATLGDLSQGEPYLRQVLALAGELGLPPVEQARLYFPLCHLLGWHGRSQLVLDLVDEGLALLGSDLSSPEAAMLVNLKSEILFNRGQRRAAMALVAQLIESLPDLGYLPELQSAYNMASMWCRYNKEIEVGFDLLRRVEAAALAQGDLWSVGYLHGWPILFLYETIGDVAGVDASLARVEELAEQTGDEMLTRQAHTFRGMSYGWCAGDWERAVRHAEEAVRMTERQGRKNIFAYVVLGLAHFSRRDWAEAAALLEIARETALAQHFRPDGARRCDIGLAWSYLHLGRREEAAALFRSVVAEEEVDTESLHLITCALAGLAAACPDAAAFQAQCAQIEAERGSHNPLPILQWQPVPRPRNDAGLRYALPLPQSEAEAIAQGWQWVDPTGRSAWAVADGLTLFADSYQDLWLNNLGAPRLLRPLRGSFALECCCSAALPDRLAMGGLLLWQDQANYLRLTWNTHGPGEINLLGCLENRDLLLGRGSLPNADRVYLRLERQGGVVRALYSADAVEWNCVGAVEFAANRTVDAGLLASGFVPRYAVPAGYAPGTALHFSSLRLVCELPQRARGESAASGLSSVG